MAQTTTLNFKIIGQTLERLDNNKIVEKAKNYVETQFSFNEAWENTTKAILIEGSGLRYKVYLNEENKCLIPNRVVRHDGFTLTVVGEDTDKNITITTNDLFIPILSNRVEDSTPRYVEVIESNTLDVTRNEETYNLEIPDDFLQENSSDETIGNLDKLLIRGKNYDVKGRKIYIHHLYINFGIGYYTESVLVDVITNDNTPLTYNNFYNYLIEKIGHANLIVATGFYNDGTSSTYIYGLYGFHFSEDNIGIRVFLGNGNTYNIPNTATFNDTITEV